MGKPTVGVGIIIKNREGEILVGKRKGSHAPYYSIPGGKLETGESFEVAAIREVYEETGLQLKEVRVIAVTNNLKTFEKSGIHFVSIIVYSEQFWGTPVLKEPDKCEHWQWCDPTQLPHPHFEASRLAVDNYLNQSFYIQNGRLE